MPSSTARVPPDVAASKARLRQQYPSQVVQDAERFLRWRGSQRRQHPRKAAVVHAGPAGNTRAQADLRAVTGSPEIRARQASIARGMAELLSRPPSANTRESARHAYTSVQGQSRPGMTGQAGQLETGSPAASQDDFYRDATLEEVMAYLNFRAEEEELQISVRQYQDFQEEEEKAKDNVQQYRKFRDNRGAVAKRTALSRKHSRYDDFSKKLENSQP